MALTSAGQEANADTYSMQLVLVWLISFDGKQVSAAGSEEVRI